MNLFQVVFLDVVLLTFPLLVYLIYLSTNKNILDKTKRIYLRLSLFTSFFMIYNYGIGDLPILVISSIVILSYLEDLYILANFFSIILILIYSNIFNNTLFLLIGYVFIALFYLLRKNKRISNKTFIQLSVIINSIIYYIWIYKYNYEYFNIQLIICVIISYFFIINIICLMYKTGKSIIETHMTYKQLQQEKQIRLSLFKITHEIKNPLAVCKGYLEIMDLNKREKTEKYIRIMQEEIDRSLNIMTDFIQFNKIKISKEKISINDLLEDTHESFKMICKTRGIKILYDNSNNNIFINGDYDRLKQVLVNILKNSVEAIDKNGTIKIETKKIANYIEIIVVDDGIGMSSDTLIKVKEMFYTTKPSGTGLGVALSNEIIEAHGGTLIYDSVLNKGTTVKIKLPIEK